ncbi:MAG: PAS domain S-box protein, partial [Desulfobacterales bacterium]|nr:PAS domain S-box protein [Desulfobacterales bacterium]
MDSPTPNLLDALDAFQDGIYIVNEDYTVAYMNRFMRELFGEGVGKKCHQVLIHRETPCEWCRHARVFSRGKPHQTEIYLKGLDRSFAVSEIPVENRDGSRSKLSIYRDITTAKTQKAQLQSSRAHYQRLFTHVGCGAFVSSKEGRFLDVNPALLKILGYQDKEEFLCLDLATDVYLRPEDRRRYQRIVEKEGKVIDYEVQWRRRDGHILHILLTSHVRYGDQGEILGYEGIVVDQTRRKRSETQLREAHDFMDRIIANSPNAILATDMDGTIRLWNRGAERLFGRSTSEVIGRVRADQLFSPRVHAQIMEMLRNPDVDEKGTLHSYPLTFEPGRGIQVEGNLSAGIIYDARGRESAVVITFVDLRERLETERELSEARQHLLQSEKLAAMGRLTSQIAHELNNPLFGIMNTLELMKTEIPPSNKRRRLLDMSLSETERLADMLKKMLSFSKPEEATRAPLDINIVIDELMVLYDKRFRENSVKVTLDLLPKPGKIMGSKDQLRQVFINLFSNAMYAMPEGGELRLATAATSGMLHITVEDTGTGIKP